MCNWRAFAGPGGPAGVSVVARLTRACIGHSIGLMIIMFERFEFRERIHMCNNVIKD